MRRPLTTILVLCSLALAGSAIAGTGWTGLRGPSHDGAVHGVQLGDGDSLGLAVGWERDLGSGYSVLAAGGGRVFAMFAAGESDVLAAYAATSGDELWRYAIEKAYAGHDGSHDGPVATPALDGGRVYGLGARGTLFAVDAESGEEVWTVHLVDDLGAEKPHYGFSTSPIVADGVLVVEAGAGEGKAFYGIDPADGSVKWHHGTDEIHYSSPIVAKLGGRSQVVAAGMKTLMGIDPVAGEVLWTYEHGGDERAMGGATVVPVPAGDDRLFIMNKIDASTMLSITAGADGGFEVAETWATPSLKGSYVIPVYHQGYLYGMSGRIFTCVDAATGDIAWRSREPGDGFPTLVGDRLVIMTKPGSLHVVKASPEAYDEVASIELFEEHSWSAPAFADGHVFVRSMAKLARIDVTSDGEGGGAGSWVAGTAFGKFLAEVDAADDKAAVIDAYLAQQGDLPIVEESGAVHFVYRGEARDVGIVGDMIGFRREDPMHHVAGTDMYHYSTRLEPDAAVTYGYIVDYADPIADPGNPAAASGLFGDVSWLAMPAWQAPGHLAEADAGRQGRFETVSWDSEVREGQTRTAEVYLPAGYDAGEQYPVLYFHGGKDVLEEGLLKNTLDNVVGQSVRPMIVVFPMLDPENDRRDIGDTEKYTEMVVTELVPMIDEKYPVAEDPMARGNAGVSRGANAALWATVKHPELFARAGVEAGFFGAEDIAEDLPTADDRPMVLYMGWGTYHIRSPHEAWDVAEDNRAAWRLLRERGHRPAGGERPDGMGWTVWRSRTADMLRALFPAIAGAP